MGGFIYIWFDLKRKMFYLGSHWGDPSDGYVCSSTRMKRAFKRRPKTFKRRILSRWDSRSALLKEEERLLQMIPDDQLGLKYYNLHKHTGHWHGRSDRAQVVEKLKASWTDERKQQAKSVQAAAWTDERREAFTKLTTGRKRSESSKQKMSAAWTPERKEAQAERLREVTRKRFENYWENNPTPKEKLQAKREAEGWVPPDRSIIATAQWARVQDKTPVKQAMSDASKGKVPIINPQGVIKRVHLTEIQQYLDDGWIRGRTLNPSKETLRKRKQT